MTDGKNLSNQDIWDRLLNAWWGKVLVGIIIFLGTAIIYSDLSQLEAGQRDRIWGPRLIIHGYEMMGKWPLVSILAVLGSLCVGWGAYQAATGKE